MLSDLSGAICQGSNSLKEMSGPRTLSGLRSVMNEPRVIAHQCAGSSCVDKGAKLAVDLGACDAVQSPRRRYGDDLPSNELLLGSILRIGKEEKLLGSQQLGIGGRGHRLLLQTPILAGCQVPLTIGINSSSNRAIDNQNG